MKIKKIRYFILLLALMLNACKGLPIGANSVDEEKADLTNQYSTDHLSENEASNLNAQLGAGYITNGRYDRALDKLEKALNLDSGNALAHNYLGVLYGRLDRPKLAYEQFNRSLDLSPNNSILLNNYAIFLCDQEEFDSAINKFKRVVGNPLYNDLPGAYNSAGNCAYKNEDYPLAEQFYRSSLKKNPNMSPAMLGLARINYIQGTYPLALSYYQRFDALAIQDADSLWLGLNILKNLQQPDKNLISSYQLQLKSRFPDSDETKWFYQNKQEY